MQLCIEPVFLNPLQYLDTSRSIRPLITNPNQNALSGAHGSHTHVGAPGAASL